jgi:hypothetical protein
MENQDYWKKFAAFDKTGQRIMTEKSFRHVITSVTNTQPQLNIPYGIELRNVGIKRSEKNADIKVSQWSIDAYRYFEIWLGSKSKGFKFL